MEKSILKWTNNLKSYISRTHAPDAEEILQLAQEINTLPTTQINQIVSESIKHAGNGVAAYIFNTDVKNAKWGETDCSSFRDELAVKLISYTVTKVSAHGFNETIDKDAAEKSWKQQMDGKTGTDASHCVLLEYLIRHCKFERYLSEKSFWAETLLKVLTDKQFINGVIVEELIASGTSLLVTMPYTFLYFLNEESYKKAMAFLINYVKDKDLVSPTEDFISRNYFISIVPFYEGGIFINDIRNACMKTDTKHVQPRPSIMSDVSPDGWTETTYGRAIHTWLDSKDGPKKFNLRTSHKPDNFHMKADVPFGGCFHGDVKVQLYNAQATTIQNLRQGDTILCGDGSKGLVSSEMVSFQIDHEMSLFGFSNEKPFFTSRHPFWTQHGWKAIDPEGAKTENTWLMVGQLKEGDFVRKIKYHDRNSKSVVHTWEEIQRLVHETYPKGTVIYGVHLREGNRSYHANGYVVHSNYPEITMDRIERGLQGLPIKDQRTAHEALSVLQPYIHRVLGPGCGEAMRRMLAGPKYNIATSQRIKNRHLTNLTIPDMTIKYLSEATDHQLTRLPYSVGVTNGHLILDGDLIDDIEYMNEDMLAWTRKTDSNEWEHGCMRFNQNRLIAHGHVCRTAGSDSTEPKESFHLVATTTNKYKCLRSENPINKNVKNPKMTDFGELEMGFKHDSAGNPEIVGKITLNDSNPLSSHGGAVNFFMDDKQKLHVQVHFSPTEASFINYIRLTGQFNYDFSSFIGEAIAYDDDGEQFEGAHYYWKGAILPTEKSILYKQKLGSMRRENRAKMASEPSSASPFETSVHPVMLEAANRVQQQLSVQELIEIPTPNKTSLNKLSFGKLINLSKYLMTDDVLKDIFGLVKPDIGEELQKIAEDNKDFLQNRFAVAYIINALKDTTTISKEITKDDKRKLEFYLNPNKADKGINGEKDFHVVNKEVARLAFLDECPQLQKFISSADGGDYWAKQLFSHITKPSFLNGLAIEQLLPQVQSIVQKYTTILYCLAPNGDYPQQFQEKVHAYVINRMSEYFTGSDKDKDKMVHILGEMFNALLKLVVDGSDKITPEIRQSLLDELKADAEKYKMDLETYYKTVSEKFQAAAATVVASMLSSKGPILARIIEAIKNNRNRFLKVVGGVFVSKILPLAAWGLSVYFTLFEYQHWDDLSVLDKSALIANTAGFAFKLLSKVPNFLTKMANYIDELIIKGGTWISEEILTLFRGFTATESVEAGIQMMMRSAAERIGARVVDTVSEAAAVNYGVEVWTFSRVAKGAMKVMNVLGIVLASVALGVSVINDFIKDAPVAKKTLDTLELVCSVIQVSAVIAEELALSTAVAPIVGIVCAIVGVILAIIGLIVGKPKPEPSTAEKFVKKQGKVFLDSLPMPPEDWKPS